MRRMNILEVAIKAAGGVSALAKSLNLEPNVVSNWRARRLPPGWEVALKLQRRHKEGVFGSHITSVSDAA